MTKGEFQVDFLRSVAANQGRIESARFSLQRGPLRFPEPLYSLTLEQHGTRSLQQLAWTPELETYLLFDLRRKVDRFEEEAERFAAILLNNFETAAASYGKDFARAVLLTILRDRSEYALDSTLTKLGVARPSQTNRHYADCVAFLKHSIDGLDNTASSHLGYSREQALSLLRAALEILLDETFHISGAAELFPTG